MISVRGGRSQRQYPISRHDSNCVCSFLFWIVQLTHVSACVRCVCTRFLFYFSTNLRLLGGFNIQSPGVRDKTSFENRHMHNLITNERICYDDVRIVERSTRSTEIHWTNKISTCIMVITIIISEPMQLFGKINRLIWINFITNNDEPIFLLHQKSKKMWRVCMRHAIHNIPP